MDLYGKSIAVEKDESYEENITSYDKDVQNNSSGSCESTDKSRKGSQWPVNVPPLLMNSKGMPIPRLNVRRMLGQMTRKSFQQTCQLTRDIISRLDLSEELHGHRGCVNCIEFNDNGRLLVSGSDDYQLLLWDVNTRRKLSSFTTTHTGNIFSVKFLPSSGSGLLVSGAGDKRVEVRDIEAERLLHTCTCHTNRVKRIATSSELQNIFFSAAEDGTVMQYDLRAPHQCDNSPYNVVVDLRHFRTQGYPSEVKCATLHPMNPFMLAVGANDPFVRVYDRRMIKLSALHSNSGIGNASSEAGCGYPSNILPDGCCQYFVPGTYRELQRKLRSLATTYLSYSSDGRFLLANLGGENIYLYDTTAHTLPVKFTPPPSSAVTNSLFNTSGARQNFSTGAVSTNSPNYYKRCYVLPSDLTATSNLPYRVMQLQAQANVKVKQKEYYSAIRLFTEAIQLCPTSPVLYVDRASVYVRRQWEGDVYEGLRDCFRALYYDPTYVRAYVKLVKCLHDSHRFEEAIKCISVIKKYFPSESRTPHFIDLCEQVKESKSHANAKHSTDNSDADGVMIAGEMPRLGNRRDSENSRDFHPSMIQEHKWRSQAADYLSQYIGHCNTTTDIKEAVFLGESGNFIAAGSDDGNLFIWDTASTNVVRIIPADENIVNCVQCHPHASLVATSGIGHGVKFWEPSAKVNKIDDEQIDKTSLLNQSRMNADPLEMLFMHMGDLAHVFTNREGNNIRMMARGTFRTEEDEGNGDNFHPHAFEVLRMPRSDGDGDAVSDVQCRTS